MICSRIRLRSLFWASAVIALGSIAQAQEREAPPVREVQGIPLPGVQGRLDHFTIDAKRKRVIFSGLGNNTVQVVDVFAGGRSTRSKDSLSRKARLPRRVGQALCRELCGRSRERL